MSAVMTEFDATARTAYVYPIDPESREDILSIDRLTKEHIRLKHRLILQSDWETNTVTNAVMETSLRVMYAQILNMGINILDEDMDNTLVFYDLIEIAASNKYNESAEKTGNINVVFTPGSKVPEIISDNVPMENKQFVYSPVDTAYIINGDEAMTSVMKRIDSIARKLLHDKYSLTLPKDWMAIAAAYTFLENLYHALIQKLVTSDRKTVMINFNDLIEFYAQKDKNGNAQIFIRPGMCAKLIIKSDATTEADED